MKNLFMTIVLAVVLTIPSAALAMKEMDHGSMANDGAMNGMEMGGAMIMLQDQEVDGVMASAHLMDVKEKMAEHGMSMTHHIMVGFMDSSREEIKQGQVAIKIKAPDGEVSKATKMMGMSGQFGVDITLDQKGLYQFMIGTKLADGMKRTFNFQYDN